jgi:hypothetical protein
MGFCDKWRWYICPRIDREVAANMVSDRVGNYEIFETPIMNLDVVIRVTPAA